MKPPYLLIASVTLNLGLATWLLLAPGVPHNEPLPAGRETLPAPPTALAPAAPAAPTFQWSQLEAEDYPTYIANLRRMGCPEQTIRDLIAADVAEIGRAKAEELERGALLTQRIREKLEQERDDLLERLLGPGPARKSAALPVAAQLVASVDVRPPLLLTAPPEGLTIAEDQVGALVKLREEFVAEMGGAERDPRDPAYLAQWQQWQPVFDQRLKTELGWRVFSELQLARARE